MSVATQTRSDLQPALGWRQYQEDYGHLKISKTPFLTKRYTRYPTRIDPRGWLKIPDRRGMSSSCGDALATCLEMMHWIRTQGKVVHLSRMFSYIAAQKPDGLEGDDVGATVSGAIKAAKVFGVCRERFMQTSGTYSDECSSQSFDDAACFRAVSHSLLSGYEQVFQYVGRGIGAVLLGIEWRESFAKTTGRFQEANGRSLGYHALAVVGYPGDERDSRGRRYLLVANSQGDDWGENGFALVAPHLFDAWGQDGESLMVGVSDLFEYRQRKFAWHHGEER